MILKVILISGKAQHGKDTSASLMQASLKECGHRVLITHYADLLKYICKSYFGWDGVKDKDGRMMLQHVGTDLIRKQNPSFWVDFVAMMLKYCHENWDYVIIPDCRFPNEISTMINNGFDVVHVRVVRDGFRSPLNEEQQMHPSETALDNVKPDIYLHNSGSINDLELSIKNLIKENFIGVSCEFAQPVAEVKRLKSLIYQLENSFHDVVDSFRLGIDYMPDWFTGAVTSGKVVLHGMSTGWSRSDDINADVNTLNGVLHANYGDSIVLVDKDELYVVRNS